MTGYSPSEMMTVAASRTLKPNDVCFVGIGAPSAACNLARLTHAPGLTLIYESGTIGAKPDILPLSIGDGELCETALTTVPVPEMFRYWLQGGRISVGFLGAAQVDCFGNINTTVIGEYERPRVRLPGGGGAPEIAAFCDEIFIIMTHSARSLVAALDFRTSLGHGQGGGDRARYGLATRGPTRLITDLCIMEPEAGTKELIVTSIHPGVTRENIAAATGWPVRFADETVETPVPSEEALSMLRAVQARTAAAHGIRP